MSKNLKKLTAFVMSVIVLATMSLSAMAMPSYTFDTAETDGLVPITELLFAENFDGDTTLGEGGKTWGTTSGGKHTLTFDARTSDFDASKNYIWVPVVSKDNGAATPYTKMKSDTSFKGEYAIEFKFNKTVDQASVDKLFFSAGYKDNTSEYHAIELGIDAADKPYYVDNTGDKQYFISDNPVWSVVGDKLFVEKDWNWTEGDWSGVKSAPEDGKSMDWYTIKVKVNTDTKKYSVYFNGALSVKDATFNCPDVNWSECGINLPYIFCCDWEVGIRYVYDDLRIYREPAGVTTIYANDFDSYSTTEEWSGSSRTNYQGVAGLGLGVVAFKGGNVVRTENGKLKAVHNGTNGGAMIVGPVAEDIMTVSTDFSVEAFAQDSSVDNWAAVLMLGSISIGQGTTVMVNKDGNIGVGYYNSTITDPNIATIEIGSTHNLTISANFSTNKCNIYLDGKLIAADRNLTKSGVVATGQDVMIGLGYMIDSPTTTVSYDNIRVYKDSREEVLDAIPTELAKIFPGESLVMKSVVLPTSIAGYEGYNISWSTDADSNIQVGADGKTATVAQTTNNQFIYLTATVSDANGDYSVSRSFEVKVWAGPNNVISDNGADTVTAKGRQAIPGSVLFLAIYDSTGALADLVIADTIVENIITATWDYSNFKAGTYTAKAMLLESKATIVPLCVPSQVITVTVK